MPGPSLLLLDPYRTALLVQGLDEGLAVASRGNRATYATLPALDVGRDRALQETVLQQLLLFESVSIIQNEAANDSWNRLPANIVNVSWDNLRKDGLIEFVSNDVDYAEMQTFPPPPGFWARESGLVERWRPLILEQFLLKKKIEHPSLFDVLIERNRPDADLKATIAGVPARFQAAAHRLAERSDGLLGLDISIFALAQELAQVEAFVSRGDAAQETTYVATPSLAEQVPARGTPEPGDLIEIVIHELIKDNIEFVLPESLRDARRLREKPEIVDFRSVFLPWLQTLRAGTADDEGRLRREVRRAARSFKLTQRSRSLSRWAVIAAVVLDLVSAGAGAVTELGLDFFSGRAERRGRWIGLSGRERASPLTQGEMAKADERLNSRRKR